MIPILLTAALVGVPAGVALVLQHRALVDYRRDSRLRAEFCSSEQTHAHAALWQLENARDHEHEQAAKSFMYYYEWPGMLAACVPGHDIDVHAPIGCWVYSGKIDCLIPLARKIRDELDKRWMPRT